MNPAEAIARIRPTLEWAESDHGAEGLLEALATLEAHLAAPAALTPVELESAEAFAARLCTHIVDTLTRRVFASPAAAKAHAVALITADRAAIATAAKLEVLGAIETKAQANVEMGFRLDIAYQHALTDVRSKLTGGE